MQSIIVFPCSPEMLDRFESTFVSTVWLSAVFSVLFAQIALAIITCRTLMQPPPPDVWRFKD